MARRAIGIDIGASRIRAVQLLRKGGRFHLERSSTQTIEPAETPGEVHTARTAGALASMIRDGGFGQRAAVAVAMPHGSVLFQTLKTDLPRLEHVRRVLHFELEDDFPLPVENRVMEICAARDFGEGGTSLLVGAASRSALQERVRTLNEAGMRCDVVDADACALLSTIAANCPTITASRFVALYLSEPRAILLAVEGGLLVNARSFTWAGSRNENGPGDDAAGEAAAGLAREIELTWRDSFQIPIPASTPLVLGGDKSLLGPLSAALRQRLPCEPVLLDPFSSVACQGDQEKDPAQAVAVGLAMRALTRERESANFLAAEALKADQRPAFAKGLASLAVLAVVVVGVWLAGMFLELHRLEAKNRDIEREMRQVFQDTLPREEIIVDELSQLEEQLRVLRAEYDAIASVAGSGISPLRILQRVSVAISEHLGVTVSDITIDARTVGLTGIATSYNSVDELRSRLEAVPEFASVAFRDLGAERGAAEVSFSLTIKMATR